MRTLCISEYMTLQNLPTRRRGSKIPKKMHTYFMARYRYAHQTHHKHLKSISVLLFSIS